MLGVVCVAAVLAWGMFVRARRQSLRELARRVESEQELRVAQIRQSERNRIAREMHDVLAHRLSLLSLHAGALELRPDAAPEEVARAAGAVAVGRGRSNAEISSELFMSVATVKARISRILVKLKLNNRTQIALPAHDAGLTG